MSTPPNAFTIDTKRSDMTVGTTSIAANDPGALQGAPGTPSSEDNAGDPALHSRPPSTSTPAPSLPPTPGQGTDPVLSAGTEIEDFMKGSAGRDILDGKGGVDVIETGDGDDTLVGGSDRDWMTGDAGDDTYVYNALADSKPGADSDVIWGWENGNDIFDLSQVDANAILPGVQAFRWIGSNAFSGQAAELRFAFDGANTIVQGDANGDAAADFVVQVNGDHALAAHDFIFGSHPASPTDIPPPAPPAPVALPVTRSPTMSGTDKQDVLRGTRGVDVIEGKGGVDVIVANGGDDIITGGANRDWLSGQGGNDTFVYVSVDDSKPGAQSDVIFEWGPGKDKIDLRQIDAGAWQPGDQAFDWIGADRFSGGAAEVRSVLNGRNTIVEADLDGDQVADFLIVINGKHALNATDFLL